jgi:hypothetical protein
MMASIGGSGRLRMLLSTVLAFMLMASCLAEKSDNSLDWKWHKGRATYYGELVVVCFAHCTLCTDMSSCSKRCILDDAAATLLATQEGTT